jgi:hypothetical protein
MIVAVEGLPEVDKSTLMRLCAQWLSDAYLTIDTTHLDFLHKPQDLPFSLEQLREDLFHHDVRPAAPSESPTRAPMPHMQKRGWRMRKGTRMRDQQEPERRSSIVVGGSRDRRNQ